jgi:hypothetical protein
MSIHQHGGTNAVEMANNADLPGKANGFHLPY